MSLRQINFAANCPRLRNKPRNSSSSPNNSKNKWKLRNRKMKHSRRAPKNSPVSETKRRQIWRKYGKSMLSEWKLVRNWKRRWPASNPKTRRWRNSRASLKQNWSTRSHSLPRPRRMNPSSLSCRHKINCWQTNTRQKRTACDRRFSPNNRNWNLSGPSFRVRSRRGS